jgi:fructoselysine-6-P-deglycase FrlB-like protein
MSFASEEIASQPECWDKAGSRAADTATGLPRPGERVAVVGCGTSYYIALAYAGLREASGQGETDAMPASEMLAHRHYDRLIFLSRSGTTTEVLDALGRISPEVAATAITADPTAPIVDAARDVIVLDFADERSVVQTRFATSALVLLRAHLGEDTAPLIPQARRALEEPIPERWLACRRFAFLGQGWTVGLAHEAALKLTEAAQAWTESYPAMEFRHGPISGAAAGSLVWSFGPPPPGLADDLQITGADFYASPADPLADLIRAQRLAVALAEKAGLDPDRPRHLSRSVILSPVP